MPLITSQAAPEDVGVLVRLGVGVSSGSNSTVNITKAVMSRFHDSIHGTRFTAVFQVITLVRP